MNRLKEDSLFETNLRKSQKLTKTLLATKSVSRLQESARRSGSQSVKWVSPSKQGWKELPSPTRRKLTEEERQKLLHR